VLEVLRTGLLATVQDLGRPGYAHVGVPRSGALDPPALKLANRLVGNPESAAAVELAYGGASFRAHESLSCAVTGAPVPVTINGRPVPYGVALQVPCGAVLGLGAASYGVRSYLAIGGGIAVPQVLGSRSTDTLSGLGPAPLRAGDLLPLGEPVGLASTVSFTPSSVAAGEIRLRARLGPRADWFTEPDSLFRSSWQVGVGDRIGVRLIGAELSRAITGELASEGLIAGAVQVPGDGQPLVFLADHPTTGGYPVIAAVHPADLPLIAQARVGVSLRFAPA
jgi:biotin-dependent carboxylase-like uncharacterized protein